MFRTLMCVALIAVAVGCSSTSKDSSMTQSPNIGKVRHVVFFKFKEGTPPEKVREVEQAFARLPRQIPQIVDFEWGTNVSKEGKDLGYTHCFLVTFNDQAGVDAYLPHPAHQEFVKILRPHLAEVHVIDYIAAK